MADLSVLWAWRCFYPSGRILCFLQHLRAASIFPHNFVSWGFHHFLEKRQTLFDRILWSITFAETADSICTVASTSAMLSKLAVEKLANYFLKSSFNTSQSVLAQFPTLLTTFLGELIINSQRSNSWSDPSPAVVCTLQLIARSTNSVDATETSIVVNPKLM